MPSIASVYICALCVFAGPTASTANDACDPGLDDCSIAAIQDHGSTMIQTAGATRKLTPVHLTNADFSSGTLIIETPGTYILDENIVFEPDTPGHFPPLDSSVYTNSAGYWLGFFAAIAVASDDVVIDLGGFEIGMSYKYAKIQRFFSVIELGSKPFSAKTGPPQFNALDSVLVSANNVVIKNGILGMSSHMGIHGNQNTGVEITDVVIKDFETGGIQLNGASNVKVTSCTIGPSLGAPGSSNNVPGLATLSQAMLLTRLASAEGFSRNPEIEKLQASLDEFVQGTDGGSSMFVQEPYNGLPDGSALYGILLHKTGPAIHDFASCTQSQMDMLSGDPLERIVIANVTIKDLHLKSDEVVKMMVDGKPVLGPAGDVVQVARLRGANGAYEGNHLSNAQAHLASLKAQRVDQTADAELFQLFGSTNVPEQVLSWMRGESTWETASAGAAFACHGDAMSHFNKGVVGMRLEFVTDITVDNVHISGLKNFGEKSPHDDLCQGLDNDEYHGADVRGLSVGGGSEVSGGYTVDLDSCSSTSGSVTEFVDEGQTNQQ